MAEYPLIISLALARIRPRLTSYLKYARHTPRAMRKERIDSIMDTLAVMLKASCMQFHGAVCAVNEGWARPLTVPELALKSGLHQRNTEYCLHDLQSVGLLDVGKQQRAAGNGSPVIVVSGVIRTFTPKFWALLGLTDLFKQAVQYAKEKSKQALKLVIPSYRKAAKRASQKLKNLVSSVLGNLSAGLDGERTRPRF